VLSPVKLEGVDDPLLYFANVQAFRDLAASGPKVREWRSLRNLLLPGATRNSAPLELVEKLLSLKLVDYEWSLYQTHRKWTPRGARRSAAPSPPGSVLHRRRSPERRDGANLLEQIGGSGSWFLVPG